MVGISKAQRAVNSLQPRPQPKTPITNDFFLPNPSAINKSDQVQYGGKPYANIHVHDETATPQDIPSTAYAKCTGFANNGESQNCTPDVNNDQIIINKKGSYLVNHNSSFTGDTNNVNYFIAAFVNNIEIDNLHFVRKIGTAGDVGSASFCGIHAFEEGDVIDVRVRHNNAGVVEYTMEYANLTVNLLD